MALVDTEPARLRLIDQVARFVLVGVLAAGVDFGTYQALLAVGLFAAVAKGISFVLGTTTAYLLNRRWTFRADGGAAPAVRFAVLYSVTFFVNVGVNALVLHLLTGYTFAVPVAWLAAQATATAINFVLLRTVVFRDRPDSPELLTRQEVLDTIEHLDFADLAVSLDSAVHAGERLRPSLADGRVED